MTCVGATRKKRTNSRPHVPKWTRVRKSSLRPYWKKKIYRPDSLASDLFKAIFVVKMPVYVYQEILSDGSDGEMFECIQNMSEATLTTHPKTGNPVRKVFHAPNLSSKYTESSTKKRLSDQNIEKHGFTRYEKDKVTGRYHKTAGKDKRAPDVVDASQLRKIQQ